MTFQSILARNGDARGAIPGDGFPDFFRDLNLDQIVQAITVGKDSYNLRSLFCAPVHDLATVYYRHEVMRDLEDPGLIGSIKAFSHEMVIIRRHLALMNEGSFRYHREGWLLEAGVLYCRAVGDLAHYLESTQLQSRGLTAFRAYLLDYARSEAFRSLQAEATGIKERLSRIRYSVVIQPGRFSVKRYEDEPDYTAEVERTFERFRQGAVKNYLSKLRPAGGMNHIEAKILDFVAELYPDQFGELDMFCQRHSDFIDETIRVFDREIQFYIAYLDFISDIKRQGLSFCYPKISADRQVFARDAFDLALAAKLVDSDKPVVPNEFYLDGPERIIVVSGPNQGGKTTFARMFGQLHYLASLGCPIPGTGAQLELFDRIFTHFEREEDIRNLRGKLKDDLIRIRQILKMATPHSIVVVNEVFASTTLQDAVFLSKAIMKRLLDLDLLCVWVTFIDELSSMSAKTVSMVSTVEPENPATRTFKILRKPADGLAHALAIARRHRLTYDQVKERVRS